MRRLLLFVTVLVVAAACASTASASIGSCFSAANDPNYLGLDSFQVSGQTVCVNTGYRMSYTNTVCIRVLGADGSTWFLKSDTCRTQTADGNGQGLTTYTQPYVGVAGHTYDTKETGKASDPVASFGPTTVYSGKWVDP